jgi:hypothetical protein
MSPRFIDIQVKDVSTNLWNRITFVYGEPCVQSRHLMWETSRRLKGMSDLPWLVLGDFNETMWGYEHFSDTPRPQCQMEEFRDTLFVCDLHNIGFCGLPYTWDNGRFGNANVKVCLDIAVVDTSWRDAFDDARVHHLISSGSDYCPILVELKKDAWEHGKTRTFCYEIMWERVNTLSEEIKKVWCSTNDRETLGGVVSKLRNMQNALSQWSREHFGVVTEELAGLQRELGEMKARTMVCHADIQAIID